MALSIEVDAGDGVNTKTYTITIMRLPEVFRERVGMSMVVTASGTGRGCAKAGSAPNEAAARPAARPRSTARR